MHHPTDRIAHTTAFVTPVMEHWLEQEIAQLKGTNVCKYIHFIKTNGCGVLLNFNFNFF